MTPARPSAPRRTRTGSPRTRWRAARGIRSSSTPTRARSMASPPPRIGRRRRTPPARKPALRPVARPRCTGTRESRAARVRARSERQRLQSGGRRSPPRQRWRITKARPPRRTNPRADDEVHREGEVEGGHDPKGERHDEQGRRLRPEEPAPSRTKRVEPAAGVAA